MDTTNLLESISRMRQHGDTARIARIVNALRENEGKEAISLQYVDMMLRGTRTMTEEVAEVADLYYETQKVLTKKVML